MKFLVSFLFILISNIAFLQVFQNIDTMSYFDRINGSIDSIDVNSGNLPSTFDGGIPIYTSDGVTSLDLLRSVMQTNFQNSHEYSNIKYSALPHLGFAYSFGGQGAQFIQAKYNQAFTDNFFIDIDYVKSSGNGVIRGSDFYLNDFGVQMFRFGKKYSMNLKGAFQLNKVSHSGGLINIDSTIQQFGLQFPDVKKNANSKNKIGEIHQENYFNFRSDSINKIGLKSFHKYTVNNRFFEEYSDTLSQLYSTINIDSNSTRDQYKLASISNGIGFFISSKKFSFDALVYHKYWGFQNLGNHIDTSEINFVSNVSLKRKKFIIKNKFNINIIGAANEFENKLISQYQAKKINFYTRCFIETKTQSPFQRSYFGNNVSYSFTNLNKQTLMGVDSEINFNFLETLKNKYSIGFDVKLISIRNPFLYNGSDWFNDSLNFNFGSFSISGGFKFGLLHINPRIIYSISKNGHLPNIQCLGRIYIKGYVFKAKKLEALIGFDASYVSSFRLRLYMPYMDTYDWNIDQINTNPLSNFHAFLSLGISEFRFFIRYENIGYFFNNPLRQELVNYPIAGNRIRVGITWDFFN
ncbi:MAG: hypothetical protein CL844_01710 [Crocinitomicaceae bacterium]|nr:hypothetical protein [Crocinitomicaceae bacterium]|tara:strand:- start:49125 stop:50861 length:1737 start_codon:yes stop_codon:yes gene_type:complete